MTTSAATSAATAPSTAAGNRRRGYRTSPMATSTGRAYSGMCWCCALAPSPLTSPSAAIATAVTASTTRGWMRCRRPGRAGPLGPSRSGMAASLEAVHVDDYRLLGRARDHDDRRGAGVWVLLPVGGVRGYPDEVPRAGLQPAEGAAGRVAEHEHRVAGDYVDAGLRGTVMVVTRAGRRGHHRGAHPQRA